MFFIYISSDNSVYLYREIINKFPVNDIEFVRKYFTCDSTDEEYNLCNMIRNTDGGFSLNYGEYNIPYMGGWKRVSSGETQLFPFINDNYRELGKNNYKAFYDYRIKPSLIMKLRVYMKKETRECGEYLIKFFKQIVDSDTRLFLFLLYHYCYTASLFHFRQSDNIINLVMEDSDYLKSIINSLFPPFVSEYVYSNIGTPEFKRKYSKIKDVPFIIIEDSKNNIIKNKICNLIDYIHTIQTKPYDYLLYDDANFAIPIICSETPIDNSNLLYIKLNKDDFPEMEMILDENKLSQYFAETFYTWSRSKSEVFHSQLDRSNFHFVFGNIYEILKASYKNWGIDLNNELDFNGDIDTFLTEYKKKISDIPLPQPEAFMDVMVNLVDEKKILQYERLENTIDKCVTYETLNKRACILTDDDSWSLNTLAFNMVVSQMPGGYSKSEVIDMLISNKLMLKDTVNKNSFQKKFTVHIKQYDSIDNQLHNLYVIKMKNGNKTKKNIDVPIFDDTIYTCKSKNYFKIGKELKGERDVFWNFGEDINNNRHMLITGQSGCGKSYLLNKLIQQADDQKLTVVIFHNQGEIPNIKGAKVIDIKEHKPGIDLNNDLMRDGKIIFSYLRQALNLREDNMVAVETCFAEYYRKSNVCSEQPKRSLFGFAQDFESIAKEFRISNYQTILSHLSTITQYGLFSNFPIDWESYQEQTIILDFSKFIGADPLIKIQTELLLCDLYSAHKKHANREIIAVFDEFQKYNTKNDSIIATILSEGRKDGWSLWLASQSVNHCVGNNFIT